jgi:nucleoside-diphosphate-sugar epimerase
MDRTLEYFKNKKIGIVGLGYIGNHLVEYFNAYSEEYGYDVRTFRRDNISLVAGETFDYFFNCGGNTGDFRNKIWSTIDSNLTLTKYLLENMRVNECYVALSSTRLYGFSADRDVLFTECSDLVNKKNHLSIDFVYDGTKMLLESILWNQRNNFDFRISICRLSNLYGRYTRKDLNDSTYLKVMIKCKADGKELFTEQNVYNTKGYIFIDDAIQGIIHSAVYPGKSDIYNICSGESYSIKHWLNYLELKYATAADDDPPVYGRNSIEKAASEINFHPRYFLSNIESNKIFHDGSNTTV